MIIQISQLSTQGMLWNTQGLHGSTEGDQHGKSGPESTYKSRNMENTGITALACHLHWDSDI